MENEVDQAPRDRLLKLKAVMEKTTLGKTSIYERVSAGSFPAPYETGPNSVAWLESEVDAWIKDLPKKAPPAQRSADGRQGSPRPASAHA